MLLRQLLLQVTCPLAVVRDVTLLLMSNAGRLAVAILACLLRDSLL